MGLNSEGLGGSVDVSEGVGGGSEGGSGWVGGWVLVREWVGGPDNGCRCMVRGCMSLWMCG